MNFQINGADRVFICGKTGSGKTYLSRHLLASLNRLIVLDGKGTLKDWNLEPYNRDSMRKLRTGQDVRIRALPDLRDQPQEFFRRVLREAFEAGNVTVYIDELYSVVPPGTLAPPELWACYTRGREFGVGVWSATQRPVWVPLVALSESEHFFMFRLSLQEDRGRLAAFLGREVEEPISDTHGFFYGKAEWDKPEYYRQLVITEERIKRQ